MRYLFLLFFLTPTLFASSQEYEDFEFEKLPNFELTPYQEDLNEVVLSKKYSLEYRYESDQLTMYEFSYYVIRVNSDEAIERNNKIYLSSSDRNTLLYQKARVISPEGKIKTLKEEDIKEGVYEDTEVTYNYFALEGLEKGSFIEFASYERGYPRMYGSLYYLQNSNPKYDVTFELTCPGNLYFDFYALNGIDEITYDTTKTEVNRWYTYIDSLPPLTEQPYLYTQVHRQGYVYKIDKNLANNKSDLVSYGPVAKTVYENLHPELKGKEKKLIKKLYKSIDVPDDGSDEVKIRAIENYIKNNFGYIDFNNDALSEIEFMIENKAGDDEGLTKLHTLLFDMAGIEHEVILTSDRSELRFPLDFEAYVYLNEYLLYLPSINKYLAPSEVYFRLGYVPGLLTATNGLYISNVKLGEFESAVGKIDYIDPLPYDATKDDMVIDVDFSDDPLKPTLSVTKTSTGYYAQYFQPYFHILDEEEQTNLKNDLVENINENIETEDITVKNIGENDFGVKPFSYSFTTDEHPFIERAGNNILFKLGEMIGPQVEMYQEEERTLGVETDHNRYYKRTITFEIPEGYTVENLDDIKIDHQYSDGDEKDLVFVSNYKVEGNKVTVVCEEYYNKVRYPVERFEDYKTVINDAADFNKIVLVMKKN